MGKIKIPKNRDIEEYVEEMERREKQARAKIVEDKRTQFKKSIEVSDKTKQNEEENQKEIEKKFKRYLERKEAQKLEEDRKQEYLNAVKKLQEKQKGR